MSDLISGYLAHLRAAGYSNETLRVRGSVLARVDEDVPHGLEAANATELEEWLGRAGWSRWTRYNYFEHLAAVFGWAAARGILDWNPMSALVRPRPPGMDPRPASEEQLAIAMTLHRPIRTAVELAAFQGLRCAEIAGLHRKDVTAEWTAVLRKGGKTQLLPTHTVVWAAIEALPPGPIVPSPRGKPYVPRRLSHLASQALTGVGLPELTLHRFRHRFATRLLLEKEAGGAGANIRTVQELMGHASVASTQIYTLVTSRQRRAAIAALSAPAAADPETACRL